MDKESNRNTIIFMVCALVLVFGYQTFVLGPAAKRQQAAAQAQAAAMAKQHPQSNGVAAPGRRQPQTIRAEVAGAVTGSPRVGPRHAQASPVRIALVGARIDDLYLKNYHYGIDPKSPLVQLLRPDDKSTTPGSPPVGWTGQQRAKHAGLQPRSGPRPRAPS